LIPVDPDGRPRFFTDELCFDVADTEAFFGDALDGRPRFFLTGSSPFSCS